ncbi:DUF4293 domain-containing protein [Paraflavisolibacter sp. H34]|uniref:DUF4293 domain-containing protein n=1 Tax=Huijunlia imazamoxiresistens TaxID=3127457 RepID=UPI00301A392B
MIQRVQSLWLLLATACDALTFQLPFFRGDWTKDTVVGDINLNALTTPLFTGLTAAAGVLAFITIFLYNNRKLQLRLCYLGVFLTVALLTTYFLELDDFTTGTVAVWIIVYFAILIGYFLAAKGIRKDQKLIRSLDRLR